MALPWLIGALVVGAVGAIASAVKGDDSSSSSSSSNNEDEERRRREAAYEKRIKEARDVRRTDARAEFKRQGEVMGSNLIDSLTDWVVVSTSDNQPFKASLTSSGYRMRPTHDSAAKPIENLLRLSLEADNELNLMIQNLDFFGSIYDVQLQGAENLCRKLDELNTLAHQQEELTKLKREIRKFEREASMSIAAYS